MSAETFFADEYEFVAEFGSHGSDTGQFGTGIGPRGIVVTDDFIFVGDYGNQRIQKFTLSGEYLDHWSSGYMAQLAEKDGYLFQLAPTGSIKKWTYEGAEVDSVAFSIPAWSAGMTLDSDGNLQVSIAVNKNVRKYDTDLNFVDVYSAIDGCGNDIHGSVDGHVYFSTEEQEFAQYTNDGVDTEWRRSSDTVSLLYITNGGHFALRANELRQIQLFDSEWNLITTLGTPEGGNNPGEFGSVQEMTVDEKGFLYISDGNPNYRIQIFAPVGEPSPTSTPAPTGTPTGIPTATPVPPSPTPQHSPDYPLELELDMPLEHYYKDDEFYLNCHMTLHSDTPVAGRFFVLMEVNGLYYYYPSWRQFNWFDLFNEDKDEWSVSMTVLDDTTEIVLESFKMPFFPFPMTGCLFMTTFTDEDVTDLISNIDVVEWGFGGAP